VIPDTTIPPEAVRRVLLCSGKVYYDLAKYREDNKRDVAIIRIEQLYPFPAKALGEALSQYSLKSCHYSGFRKKHATWVRGASCE
jgi:multifunctional 2-oxoglutarate metabolism enzyme